MNIHELAKFLDDINRENGFESPTWQNLPVKVMMTVTELDEARDAVFGDHGHSFEEELADVAIRLLSLLYSVWGQSWHDRRKWAGRLLRNCTPWEPVETALWRITGPLCKAVEAWRHENRDDVQGYLENALKETYRLASDVGIALDNEILVKADKNSRRGKWHGKANGAG